VYERERIEGVFHPSPPALVNFVQHSVLNKTVQHRVLNSSSWWRLWGYATAIPVGALLLASVPLLTAFEAHVVNVTAKIERRPVSCDARSLGYWANHDGCSKGTGESIHAQKVREISQGLMGAFASYTGEEICEALWMPNCGPGGVRAGRLCRARAHTLADISNIAAGVLDTAALIAAADDGTIAFDRLGLTPFSSVDEALTAIEIIILDPSASSIDLRHASYVAQRIYSFYEEENPFSPRCIYDPDEVPLCFERASDKQFRNQSATTTGEALDFFDETEVSVAAAALAAGLDERRSDVDETDAGSGEEGNDARSLRESRAHTGSGGSGTDGASESGENGSRDSEDGEGIEEGGGSTDTLETSEDFTMTTVATTTSATTTAGDIEPERAICALCESAHSRSTPTEGTLTEEAAGSVAESEPPVEEATSTSVGEAPPAETSASSEQASAADAGVAEGTAGNEDGTGSTEEPAIEDANVEAVRQ